MVTCMPQICTFIVVVQESLMSSSAKQLNQIIFTYEFLKNTLILSKYNSTNNNGKKKGREEKNKKTGQESRNSDINKSVKEKKQV